VEGEAAGAFFAGEAFFSGSSEDTRRADEGSGGMPSGSDGIDTTIEMGESVLFEGDAVVESAVAEDVHDGISEADESEFLLDRREIATLE